MSSCFLIASRPSLVLCLALAGFAGCGKGSMEPPEMVVPGVEADADREAGEDAPAPPRHYAPGDLPSCADARPFVEPMVVDAGIAEDATVVEEPAPSDADVDAAMEDVSVTEPDASVDDVSVTVPDASVDDASIPEDAGEEPAALAAVEVIEPGDPGPAAVTFTIRADRGVHPISSLIYGTNDLANTNGNGMGLLRSGGNRWTAFNWENGASNAGKDFKFQNDNFLATSDAPGLAVYTTIRNASITHAVPLLTVPIVDHVAYDKGADGDVRLTPDYLKVRFKENLPTKQAPFSMTPDPDDDYVYQDEFVSWVKNTAAGAPVAFSLDNEPDLWSSTHPEVHPTKATYDELVARNIDFALAIKNVWPEAKVFGFVSFGWSGYVSLQGAPDANEKGDFVDYYLSRMWDAECHYGKRLVDYLDLHWYSEIRAARTRITSAQTAAPVVDARLQAPRSLWDPTFVESSWITDPEGNLGEVPIALIPRMLEKIRRYYPGTQLSITEWTYGGGADISGGLATADALGIFGKTGLGAAASWPLNAGPFTYAAFRVFRNFDGKGAKFGDTSIEASTSDVAASSIYASIDSTQPDRVVVVAINKEAAEKSATLRIAHASPLGTASVYTLTAAAPSLVAAPPLTASATNAFSFAMPARSVSVLVLGP